MFFVLFFRYGASGVWVGTRFVASVEAGAPKMHKELVLSAGYDDVVRTLIYSGRPMSVRKTPYVAEWLVHPHVLLRLNRELNIWLLFRETSRRGEIEALVAEGKIPHEVEVEAHPERSAPGRQCSFTFPLGHPLV